MKFSSIAFTQATASTLPLAPKRWPCIDFVDEMASVLAELPNTSLIARVSFVERRSRPVCVEIADVGGGEVGIHECLAHGLLRHLTSGIDHVLSVRGHA